MTADFAQDIAAVASIDAVPKILEVVCRMTGMGFAAVARVTDDRWIACAVRDEIKFGLQPGGELKVETTICNEIRDSGKPVIIDHVAQDEVYCKHNTPAMYGFQSYISMPIFRGDGSFFGTLCAIDPRPAKLNTPETVGMFKLFSELIAMHLDSRDRLAASEAALLDERKTSELREQFIAVLGHDLRNPLASIDAATHVLKRTPLDKHASSVVDVVQRSVRRMGALIEDVLDFARARMGTGLPVECTLDDALPPALEQVVAELQAAHPTRAIQMRVDVTTPVYCDRARIAQLLSNLVGNALTHGSSEGPIEVAASTKAGVFELAVSNRGKAIPPDAMGKLFHPFERASGGAQNQGLGLGLYISSEIARAHGGTLDVSSTAALTRFTLRIPPAQQTK